MGKANRPSTIDQLPEEVRSLIGQLRQNGRTIDMILTKLRELDVDVSRSALGRHVRSLSEIGERMRRSREMATALAAQLGKQPDNKLASLNLELMHTVVMEIMTQTEADDDGEVGPVTLKPADAMFLAKALGELSRTQKLEEDRAQKIRDAATKAAAEAAGVAAKSQGMSADTVQFIMHAVLGSES